MNTVIFSIDQVHNPRVLANFLKHINGQVVSGNTSGSLVITHGFYKGKIELSFIMNEDDYFKFVTPHGYVANQESIIVVLNDHKGRELGYFQYLSSTYKSAPTPLRVVSKEQAMQLDGWTYRPDLDKYWSLS